MNMEFTSVVIAGALVGLIGIWIGKMLYAENHPCSSDPVHHYVECALALMADPRGRQWESLIDDAGNTIIRLRQFDRHGVSLVIYELVISDPHAANSLRPVENDKRLG